MMEGSSLQRQTTAETQSGISLFKRDFSKLGSFVDNMKETLRSSEVQFRAMERLIDQSMQILVKSSISGKTITLDVKRTSTIDDINTMIQDKEGISRNRRATSFYVTFGGKQLEGKRTVAYYNIEKGSTLHYVARFIVGSKIQVSIKSPFTGRTITIHTVVSDTIGNLKLMVQGKIGILADDQRFIIRGRQLEDGRKLLDYNIRESSVVYLVKRVLDRGATVKVYVRNLSKRRFALNVGFFDTIGSVKARILDRVRLSPDGDRLFGLVFQGNSLDEDRLVGHYNIVTNCTICMIPM